MKAAAAYLFAVLIASILIGQEIVLWDWLQRWLVGAKIDSQLTAIAGMAVIGTAFIMPVTFGYSIIPFLLFYPVYRRQRGRAASIAAMVFGVLVASAGLSLALDLLAEWSGFGLRQFALLAFLSLPAGLAGGWMFHKIMASQALKELPLSESGEARRGIAP